MIIRDLMYHENIKILQDLIVNQPLIHYRIFKSNKNDMKYFINKHIIYILRYIFFLIIKIILQKLFKGK